MRDSKTKCASMTSWAERRQRILCSAKHMWTWQGPEGRAERGNKTSADLTALQRVCSEQAGWVSDEDKTTHTHPIHQRCVCHESVGAIHHAVMCRGLSLNGCYRRDKAGHLVWRGHREELLVIWHRRHERARRDLCSLSLRLWEED